MLDQLARVNMSIYFQTLAFIVLLALLLRLHWKMGSIVHLAFSVAKYLVFLLVFIYLFLNWASDVNPTLRSSSILVMTLINLYMLWHVLLAAFELPYRRALRNCVDGACTPTDLERTFSTGKRFYKLRYLWSSLTCGVTPWLFLRGIAAERTRDDLHRLFVSLDPASSIFGSDLFLHYLRHQLAADKSLPADKRADQQHTLDTLARDGWLNEKTGAFLHLLLASPETLLEMGLKESLRKGDKPA